MFHILCRLSSYSNFTSSLSCYVPCTVSAAKLFEVDPKFFMWCPMYCLGYQVIRSWPQVFHVMCHALCRSSSYSSLTSKLSCDIPCTVSAANLFEVDPKFFMWSLMYCVGPQVIRSWPQVFHVMSHVLCRPPSISYVDISFFRNGPYLIEVSENYSHFCWCLPETWKTFFLNKRENPQNPNPYIPRSGFVMGWESDVRNEASPLPPSMWHKKLEERSLE